MSLPIGVIRIATGIACLALTSCTAFAIRGRSLPTADHVVEDNRCTDLRIQRGAWLGVSGAGAAISAGGATLSAIVPPDTGDRVAVAVVSLTGAVVVAIATSVTAGITDAFSARCTTTPPSDTVSR